MSSQPPIILVRRDGRPISGPDETERGSHGGEPPDNGSMERRVTKLEEQIEKTNERLATIDVRLATIQARLDHLATKADVESVKTAVAQGQNSIIKWVVGAIILVQVVPQIPALIKSLFGNA